MPAGVFLLCVLCLQGVRRHTFTLDSLNFMHDPRVVHARIGEIFATDWWNRRPEDGVEAPARALYRPATLSALALLRGMTRNEDLLAERSPPVHLGSLFLHAGAAALLALLVTRLLQDRAGAGLWGAGAGLALGLHPAASEVVGTAVGLAESLALCSLLGSLVALLRFASGGRRRWLLVHALTFGLALLAKEGAAVGVLAVPLLLGLAGGVPWRRALRLSVPALVVFAGWMILRRAVLGAFLPPVGDPVFAGFSGGSRLATALAVVGSFDLPGLVWPGGYVPNVTFHDLLPSAGFGDGRTLLGVFALLAWLALTVLACRRDRVAAFGLLIFAASLFLVSNLLQPIGAIAAARFLYVPFAGLALALAAGASRAWPARGRIGRPLVLVAAAWLLPVSGILGILEAGHWKDRESLWSAALERSRSPVALRSRAVWLRDGRKQFEASWKLMREAAETDLESTCIPGTGLLPENVLEVAFMCSMDAASSRAMHLRDPEGSVPMARRALELARRGRQQREAVEGRTSWKKHEAAALSLLGQLGLLRASRKPVLRQALVAEARQHLEQARVLDPDDWTIRMRLVNCWSALGDGPRHALEFARLLGETRPHWGESKSAFQVAWSYADYLDSARRTVEALRLRCEAASAGARFVDPAGLFQLGLRASREPRARRLAKPVLEAFLREALPEDARRAAEARRLLQSLR